MQRDLQHMLDSSQGTIGGVAFDLEGTIINLESIHWTAHRAAMQVLGIHDLDHLNLTDPNAYKHPDFIKFIKECSPHFIGGPNTDIMREIIGLAESRGAWIARGETEEERQASRDSMLQQVSLVDNAYVDERFANLTEEDCRPRDGFIEVLQLFLDRRIPVAIASLTETSRAERILRLSGLDRYFSREENNVVFLGDLRWEKNTKPEPEVYIKAAQQMGLKNYGTDSHPLYPTMLAFEDSHNGIIAARRAGAMTIGVPTVWDPEIRKRLLEVGSAQVVEGWESRLDLDLMRVDSERAYAVVEVIHGVRGLTEEWYSMRRARGEEVIDTRVEAYGQRFLATRERL